MNRRFFAVAALAMAGTLGVPFAANAQQTPNGTLSVPVKARNTAGTYVATGTFVIKKFVAGPEGPLASGLLTLSYDGQTIIKPVTAPVTKGSGVPTVAKAGASSSVSMAAQVGSAAVCDVLYLNIGPIHLDLLGLVVDLDPIVLDVNAESGPGNLLGNLLCGLVGLLDNPLQNLTQLVTSLNQLLNLLNSL